MPCNRYLSYEADLFSRFEEANYFGVFADLGDIKRRLVEFILQLLLCAALQKEFHRFYLPHHCRLMKRCIAQIAHNIHVGTGFNQHFHIVNGTLTRGKMQESVIYRPSLVWIRQFKTQEFRMGLVLLKYGFQLLF